MKGRKWEKMTSDVSNVNLLAAILLIVQHVYQMLVMTCTWSAVRLWRITTGHLGQGRKEGGGGKGRGGVPTMSGRERGAVDCKWRVTICDPL